MSRHTLIVPAGLVRRISLPPDARSSGAGRRLVRAALADGEVDEDLSDTALLLASELCENAVLHAGTEFELTIEISPEEVMVAVVDQGSGPLEQHLARPRPQTGRAATHGRGLLLIETLSTAWGTRHDSAGHRVWFTLDRTRGSSAVPAPTTAATLVQPDAVALPTPDTAADGWPTPGAARRLLHLSSDLATELTMREQVGELLRRLCEVGNADGAAIFVDYGDGRGTRLLARYGMDHDGPQPPLEVLLPVQAPLRGTLVVQPGPRAWTPRSALGELAELSAHRAALAMETDWLRGLDQRRRGWMAYLADASELLAQSTDLGLTVAMVPQIVVPRLGPWCAVYLLPGKRTVELAALTHADEESIEALRAALDPTGPISRQLADVLAQPGGPTATPTTTADGHPALAVPLVARNNVAGILMVGRWNERTHSAEEIVLISDVARRSALAIDNARNTSEQIATAQALQQALLPRGLPTSQGVEFAAEYLPASSGSEVGGDFYDVLELDGNRWLASVGDVCGKGAKAAARTGLVRDVLRVLLRDGRPLDKAVTRLNDLLLEAADPFQFCTVAVAMITQGAPGRSPGLGVDLVLAGHERPVLLRADGTSESVGIYGTAVGLLPNPSVTCVPLWLKPGDALVVYTDGVTEQRASRGGSEQFGEDRLRAILTQVGGKPAAEIVTAIRAAVSGFGSEPQHDDIALLVVRALG